MKKIMILSLSSLISVAITSFSFAGSHEPTHAQADHAQTSHPQSVQTATSQLPTAPSWLGVWIDDIPYVLGTHLSSLLKENQGVMVKNVSPDSPAEKAGIKTYDIIAQLNNQEIFSKEQLTHLIRSTAPETAVTFTLIRKGKEIKQDVVLTAMQAKQAHPTSHTMNPYSSPRHHLPSFPQGLKSPFNHPRFDQFFNRPFPPFDKSFNQQSGSWSNFESINIQSTGKDKHRAEVKYEDSQGNKKEFIFEGNKNELKQQIMAHKEMDEDKKQSLLQALDMNDPMSLYSPFDDPDFRMPGWFHRPFPRGHRYRR